jgi:hypothetical protein
LATISPVFAVFLPLEIDILFLDFYLISPLYVLFISRKICNHSNKTGLQIEKDRKNTR